MGGTAASPSAGGSSAESINDYVSSLCPRVGEGARLVPVITNQGLTPGLIDQTR